VNAVAGEAGGEDGHLALGGTNDDRHLLLAGAHPLDGLTHNVGGQGGELVGGHHPRGGAEHEHPLGGDAGQTRRPGWGGARTNARRCVEHQVGGVGPHPQIGRTDEPLSTAGLDVVDQLVASAGQAQELKGRHGGRVDARMAHR